MKKNLVVIFAFLILTGLFSMPSFASEKKVLNTDEKEAVMIDDTKMQDVSDMPDEREIKKFKKEQEKINKENAKKEEKELKKQRKEEEKLQKEQLKKEENVQKEEIKEESTKMEVKDESPVADVKGKEETKEEKTIEDIKEEEPVEIKGESATDEAKLPKNKHEEVDKKAPGQLYKKNLTYEDIEKNAVSVNEFLQFTDKQNEKFSLFYYKTTSKLSEMTKQIKNKEQEKEMVKRSRIVVKDQIAKIEKIDKELLKMYKERDEFYNKALEKFNSMLNKKQQIKWEILQEMGYRFFPEFE